MTVVAVTGASGFVGRHVVEEAARAGANVVPVPSLRSTGGAESRSAARDLETALHGADAVLHLAARAHVLREQAADSEQAFTQANVELTRMVAEAAVRARVPRFVFVSSAGVLGDASPPAGFDETSPPNPHDAYTRSKLAAEQWLDTQRPSLEVVIVRPPLVYGPGARGNFERLMRGALAGWPMPIGAMKAPRSLIGVRNLARFLLLCATHRAAPGAPLLIADRETTTLAALHAEIARFAGTPNRAFSIPPGALAWALRALGRGADAARLTHAFVVKTGRADDALGWVPPYARNEELAWTVKTHLQQAR